MVQHEWHMLRRYNIQRLVFGGQRGEAYFHLSTFYSVTASYSITNNFKIILILQKMNERMLNREIVKMFDGGCGEIELSLFFLLHLQLDKLLWNSVIFSSLYHSTMGEERSRSPL